MTDYYEDVRRLRLKFGFTTQDDGPPRLLEPRDFYARVNHKLEELEELIDAYQANDLPAAADAIADLIYVALGTAQAMRLPFDQIWHRVHRANMAKRRVTHASESKRGDPMDLIKPDGWRPPDVAGVLADAAVWWGEKGHRPGARLPRVGQRVRSLVEFAGVPAGTEGVVDEDYGSGVTVAWDLADRPLPAGYARAPDFRPPAACERGAPMRDGFDKVTELKYLEVLP